ncbi:hypothetical protein FACS189440_22280 [Bacteroidia bacterium]|nr:hypothetical protein FACS189440_22280 [Bacteroidia bacterium]
MNLTEELNKLQALVGKDPEGFIAQYNFLQENFTTEDEKKLIHDFVESAVKQSVQKIDNFVEDAKVKVQLINVSKIISLSYIAENYFDKTRNWLYQRINGSVVNGKPARFTPSDIDKLNYALQDVSKKIGSTVISL